LGGSFKDVKVEVNEEINKGKQTKIYDAKVEFKDDCKLPRYGYYVVNVMKGDCPQ
jgi:hypothetical protein